ncbi:hypothetical protein [Hoeflea sp. TYP-13]|uniref:hypothetical protein n=1 Tax=Hoeflea sp. TYP-13 TaxID=3230023 RepID=UPI0034C62430
MRVLATLIVLFVSIPALAEERRLSGKEIASLLPEITASIGSIKQTFAADGGTVFTQDGRVSNGRWRVRGDFYCSTWPPSGAWRCYEVHFEKSESESPDRIIWVDAQLGDKTINFIMPKAQ